jgi:hypothetical protein
VCHVDLQSAPPAIPCYSFFKNVYLLDLQFCPDLLPLGVPECLARKIMLMIAKEKEGGMKENIQKRIKGAGVMRWKSKILTEIDNSGSKLGSK